MPKVYEWNIGKCDVDEIEVERIEGSGLTKHAISKEGRKLSLGMHRTASKQTMLECVQVVLSARRNSLKEELARANRLAEEFNTKWADTIKQGQQSVAELEDMFD